MSEHEGRQPSTSCNGFVLKVEIQTKKTSMTHCCHKLEAAEPGFLGASTGKTVVDSRGLLIPDLI